MRKQLIKQLDFKERNWLYKAIFRMILADKTVAKEEVDELMETLRLVAGRDIKDFKEVTASPEFLDALKPMYGIPYERAFIMLSEIVRVAAIDSNVAIEEEELLQEIISLLGFQQSTLDKVMKWAKQLAIANNEEEKLKIAIQDDYIPY